MYVCLYVCRLCVMVGCLLTLYLCKMSTSERIRFAMWTSNDFLPGLKNVGWVTAKQFHREYESLKDEDEKVTNPNPNPKPKNQP